MTSAPSKGAALPSDRDWRSGLVFWIGLAALVSQLVVAWLTFGMLREVKNTNDLTRREQDLTLRPYLVPADELGVVGYIRPGTPQEMWLVTAGVGNKGSLPAMNVRVNAWIDDRPDNVEVPLPNGITSTVVPANSAAVVTVNETKIGALTKAQGPGCFLHLNAFYDDQDGKPHKVVATRALNYVEGKAAGWVLIGMSAD